MTDNHPTAFTVTEEDEFVVFYGDKKRLCFPKELYTDNHDGDWQTVKRWLEKSHIEVKQTIEEWK